MRKAVAKTVWAELTQLYHEAFLVQTYGQAASGISPERIQEMLDRGILQPEDLHGVLLPGMKNTVDPLSFMYRVSKVIEDAPAQRRPVMRDWSMARWMTEVDRSISEEPEAPPVLPSAALTVATPDPSTETPPSILREDIPTPDWMTTPIAAAYQEALTRAGEYARGLGNTVADEVTEALEESWGPEEIEEEADAEKRQEHLSLIREKVAEALATHRDYQELAQELARATGLYAHNWERIARTELQGAYNEGVFLEAVEDWGKDTHIARVTESGACPYCRKLLRDKDGLPKIFPAQELINNGTNVGKKKADWLATVWPIHPNCRCDIMAVPPGMAVDSDGVLEMKK